MKSFPNPHWPEEKLRRYDAAWARVFQGMDPELFPRFGKNPNRDREALALAQHRTGRTLRRLASFLPRHRKALLTLAGEFDSHARSLGTDLPPDAPAPTGMTPGQRVRQLIRELKQRQALCARQGDARGEALCRKAVSLLERIR